MGDKPGHAFHGNQYTTGSDWAVGESRTFEREKVRDAEGRHVADAFNEISRENAPHTGPMDARAEYKKAFREAAAKPKLTDADHQKLAELASRARSGKHKAETSTEHTGLDHLKKEHPIKEIYHAIASIADDVASAIEDL